MRLQILRDEHEGIREDAGRGSGEWRSRTDGWFDVKGVMRQERDLDESCEGITNGTVSEAGDMECQEAKWKSEEVEVVGQDRPCL